jgi:hypothetical protein
MRTSYTGAFLRRAYPDFATETNAREDMKTVYYIVGPSSSGKTTAARKLVTKMDIPLYHADLVYDFLHQEYKPTVPASHLVHYRKWDDPRHFGLESWGPYKTIDEAKEPMFKRLIGDKESDIILEGFTLSFPSERKLVEKAVGPHRAVILRIDLPFEKWAEFFEKKKGKSAENRMPAFQRLRSCFAAQESDTVYVFSDPDALVVHWSEYQRTGFTDKKIAALKIPIQKGDIVNDVGCNAGEIGKWCLDQGASLVRGYETNWRFLDDAVKKGLEPHLGDVETGELEPADVTLCVSTFQYFKNPRDFLRKARAATRRLFVLELPIYQAEGMVAKFYEKGRHMDYSTALIEFWLREHFAKVERVGESIPPNRSYRLVYHCGV